MQGSTEPQGATPVHVSLVAIPEAAVSTLSGIFDVLNGPTLLHPANRPFAVEIVGSRPGPLKLASGIPVTVHRGYAEVTETDIVIVPSILLPEGGWQAGGHADLVEWALAMHRKGALLCSACSGIFPLAETGLFNGMDATVHFGYAQAFSAAFPQVPIHPERVLVVSGRREELVTSGASMTWHDLVLYLIARFAGATVAQDVARFFALQWHQDRLTPYIVFEGRKNHGDQLMQSAQDWLSTHFSIANPVEEMVRRAGIAEWTFKRRFTSATGMSPIAYVQRLRIEDAKRRLFKRVTGLTPGSYRRRFRIPDYARAGSVAR